MALPFQPPIKTGESQEVYPTVDNQGLSWSQLKRSVLLRVGDHAQA
jgi:hypothetical protein